MSGVPNSQSLYNNVLYIGDEARTCMHILEKFNDRLLEIQSNHVNWFNSRAVKNRPAKRDKLQYHISYHFEGGVAIFKFKKEDELPAVIRDECLSACIQLSNTFTNSIAC